MIEIPKFRISEGWLDKMKTWKKFDIRSGIRILKKGQAIKFIENETNDELLVRTDYDGTKVRDGKQHKAQNNRDDGIDVFPHKRIKREEKGNCPKCKSDLEEFVHSNLTLVVCTECEFEDTKMTEKQKREEQKIYWDMILDDPSDGDQDYEFGGDSDKQYEIDVEEELEYIYNLHDLGGI